MFKRNALIALLSTLPFTASAQWIGGFGYTDLSEDDLSFGAATATLGYEIQHSDTITFTPSATYGIGIKGEEFFGVDVDLEKYIALALRGQLQMENGSYVFIQPSYAKVEVEASGRGFSSSASSDWEFGGGVGLGYKVNEKSAIEVSYEKFDGTKALSLGLRFKF